MRLMRLMKYLLFIPLCFFLFPLHGYAIDSNGHFAVWGKGSKSCHSFNIAKNTKHEDAFKHYIMGYLTASNVQIADTYRIAGEMDIHNILDWLGNHCETHPVIAFEKALADFIIQNYENRLKQSPKK